MKNQYLYLIVVLVILVIAVIGLSFFSAQAAYIPGAIRCPRWTCTDIQYFTCPNLPGFSSKAIFCDYSTDNNMLCNLTRTSTYTCASGLTPYCSGGTLSCTLPSSPTKCAESVAGGYCEVSGICHGIGDTCAPNAFECAAKGQCCCGTAPFTPPQPASYTCSFSTPLHSSSCMANASGTYLICTESILEGVIGPRYPYSCYCYGGTMTCTGPTSKICSIEQPFSWCKPTGTYGLCPYND